jgi:hypothetical protein
MQTGRRGVLNDKDQHLHLQLMEPEEEADHLHLVQRILPKVVNEVWVSSWCSPFKPKTAIMMFRSRGNVETE